MSYIQLGLKDDYLFKKADIIEYRLMVKDGIPYIVTTAEISISDRESPDSEYTSTVTTITALRKDIPTDEEPVMPDSEEYTASTNDNSESNETLDTTRDEVNAETSVLVTEDMVEESLDTDIYTWDSESLDEQNIETPAP
ncbi:MAG: hypothetical protein E7589_08185 [Ruminococcaceae bacterium]|nr:hypothetical protein [Oscillospiraceae bacterium]